jgi:transposase
MWHVGIDLHRETVVIAGVRDSGEAFDAVTFSTQQTEAITQKLRELRPFRAVVEASGTYRWLYDLLSPLGTVLLAHPFRLRAMVLRRSKTDKLDAMLLAQLLRINQVPLAYVPPEAYHRLRGAVRYRARLGREMSRSKCLVRQLLARHNIRCPFRTPFGQRGLRWLEGLDLAGADRWMRRDLLTRLRWTRDRILEAEESFQELREAFPQVEAILDIHGIGLFTGLLIVAELGEVQRFRSGKQVGAYAGLTARVNQSGGHCYHGHISKQGSSWLRWALVEAAMKVIKRDVKLSSFYQRVRKRSSSKIARVAVARKLAEICWKRLRRWERDHAVAA